MTLLTKKIRRLLIFFMILFLAFTYLTIAYRERNHCHLKIGAKNCTECRILGEIMGQLIEAKTGLSVEKKYHFEGTFICFKALMAGDIDLYAEYTGTALVSILNKDPIKSPHDCFQYVQNEFFHRFGLLWLSPFGFENEYVLVMKKDLAKHMEITTLSDIQQNKEKIFPCRFAIDPEFSSRKDFALLKESYFSNGFSSPLLMDQSLLFLSLENQSIDCCSAFLTDGKIISMDLKILEDDQQVMSSYLAAPLVRKEIINTFPELQEILGLLNGKISNDEMRRMNFDAEINGRKEYDIARDFLVSCQLL